MRSSSLLNACMPIHQQSVTLLELLLGAVQCSIVAWDTAHEEECLQMTAQMTLPLPILAADVSLAL